MPGGNPVSISADTSEANYIAGFLETLSTQIGTPQHVGPVLKFVHKEMSIAFKEFMSTLAGAHPDAYHHVYEWGEVGNPGGELWEDVLYGGGATRTATFEWRASTKTVPVMQDAADVGVKQIHVFTWKAPVMEYETNITITPQRGEFLSVFTGPQTPEGKYGKLRMVRGPITVAYPGGEATHGAFTKAYVDWWSGAGAASFFDSRLRRLLEQDLAGMPLATALNGFKAGVRSRTKNFGLNVFADAAAAESAGRNAARSFLSRRDANYLAQAAAREAIIYGT